MTDTRLELGRFLRAMRERSPAEAGGRRRTPGLRREELAVRAGISTTWLAWLEQGREANPSPHALARLARALALSVAERAYLFELAGRLDPEAPVALALEEAPDSVRVLVDFAPGPAYGLDRTWRATCWNAAAARLFPGWLDDLGERNLLRYMFLRAEARAMLPDWHERARRLIAEFRADHAGRHGDPVSERIVADLRGESAEFASLWDEQVVQGREGGLRRFDHPWDGHLAFRQFTWIPADRPDTKVVVLHPA
ncbi:MULTISPECIES: helix-turn-helix domain-containing protein [unclassified Novosphingobium]|uniref:helix-turn-helix domain-containing protein n=1 Tax=unclassified Novosphingobium TaxID=2644732 RepID=UPI000D318DEE|nr:MULTISPECIES: helix-turn-helix transcriptional regulator [unclassified Novosphingobium]PTR08621.1 transcriptional regulator with XRE-family HTH domain [Novosphingobium sp. GV055]PUB01344.1 transcriptional regulator with XRE-family HTH domain [Novosphingobium sp. GV061]PUB16918.1 transcriptional regulator with XRE-family HTH domain [Novosphingobium sp. GV079]PUB39941.1 transcriptional regulator with XRE-family HTH domain [Novosphingobium sp. GV027]